MSKAKLKPTNYLDDTEGEGDLDETARMPVLLRKSDVSNEAANDGEFSLSDKLAERVEQLFSLIESIERRLDGISEAIDAKPSRTSQAGKKKTSVSKKKKTAASKKKKTTVNRKKAVTRKKKTNVTRRKKSSSGE